ncbi:hypothetical protein EI42_04969 [Thermosporothrix hazakensis]|jgi:hypothetical protein|uniref:Uncharacterized protein n=1 Tax=Thermosporothrix hazakensis TaxID=644383 RepID=A0A326U0D9_THEHA|nr:hypothetical protein [Thermosporothrix hazakensis]PZW23586.1 hypothetical protein EI42_04969 [Thermosporothrix hazakensis]GCE51048.1 hypothetical protein KTH_59170 [Thermosporothrix hazakensis]
MQQEQSGDYQPIEPYEGYKGMYEEQPRVHPEQAEFPYDDAFIDALAQRLAVRLHEGARDKIYPESTGDLEAERPRYVAQRTAITIVTLLTFLPLAWLCFSMIGGFLAFLTLLCVGGLIVGVYDIAMSSFKADSKERKKKKKKKE